MTLWLLTFAVGVGVWSASAKAQAQAGALAPADAAARRSEPRLLNMPRARLDQLLRQTERERDQGAGQHLLPFENQCLRRGGAPSLEVQFGKLEENPLVPVLPRLSQRWVRLSWVGDARALVLGLTSEAGSEQPGALFITTPKRLLRFELAEEGFPVLVDRDRGAVVVLYQAWQSQHVQLARVDWPGPRLTQLLTLPNLPGMPRELVTLEGSYYLQWASPSGPGGVVQLVANGGLGAHYPLETSGSRLFKAGGALYVVDKAHRKLLRLDADLNPVERWRIETGTAPRAKGPAHAP